MSTESDVPESLPRRNSEMLHEDQIGPRIRKLRLDRGLTQQQLATDARMTKSYLSKIENSDSAPPVSTLINLAQALGVTMDVLFSEQDAESVYTLVRKAHRQTMARVGTRFGYSYEPLAPKFPGRRMEPFILTNPPDMKTSKTFQHRGQEFVFVLEGRLRFKMGTEEIMMEQGDAMYFDSSIAHSGVSADDKRCQCLVVMYSGDTERESTEHTR